ncbi:MAG: hypothetical protein JO170_22990 [Verrucomicrobia bacterium]|nr:hypothetical protein [Verrucomicrobiota bacterium]
MHLDYRLNEDRETDWSSVTEEDLRYRVALGNLVFHVGSKDFSAAWGWIPLVDLAASFAEIVRKLEAGSASETFEFTESDAWIRFERKGEKVLISTSYGEGVAEIALHSASAAVKSFRERLRAELDRRHPQAAHNAAVRKLLGAA